MEALLYIRRTPALSKYNVSFDPAIIKKEKAEKLPPYVQWPADNFNNLLEQPTQFYAVLLGLTFLGVKDKTTVRLAWGYVGLRFIHSMIHVTTNGYIKISKKAVLVPTGQIDVEDGLSEGLQSTAYNVALKLAAAHEDEVVNSAIEKKSIKKIDWLGFNGMGFGIFHTLLLNLPLGVMAIFTIVGSGWLGRTYPGMRHHIYTLACIPVIVGCVLLWQLPPTQTAGRIIGIYLVGFFGSCYVQVILFGTNNFAGYMKKSMVAAGISVAYCLGNIIGALLFNALQPGIYWYYGVLFRCHGGLSNDEVHVGKGEQETRGGTWPSGVSHGLEDMTEKDNKDFRFQL
ncbi:allantoate permease [Fusarium mundagurra]|uniref:Allantoate permease n=1 Tax=Fusarium mundagurra TaxID=1567541 RepID=A0A8H6D5G7_9HYPO|nr:allantoate permease [Fusarium mundagurra]